MSYYLQGGEPSIFDQRRDCQIIERDSGNWLLAISPPIDIDAKSLSHIVVRPRHRGVSLQSSFTGCKIVYVMEFKGELADYGDIAKCAIGIAELHSA